MRPAQRLARHHGGGQVVFPLHIGAHQTADVKRILHKMHIVIARAGQFAAQGVGRFASQQHDRQAAAQHVVHAHDRIGSAGVDMHHHRLALAGQGGIAGSHVDGHILMRAEDELRMGLALGVPAGQLLDQADMVGAQIGKHMGQTQLAQALEKVMGAQGAVGLRLGHGDML